MCSCLASYCEVKKKEIFKLIVDCLGRKFKWNNFLYLYIISSLYLVRAIEFFEVDV